MPCNHCGDADARLLCGSCHAVAYCNVVCQGTGRGRHKAACAASPLARLRKLLKGGATLRGSDIAWVADALCSPASSHELALVACEALACRGQEALAAPGAPVFRRVAAGAVEAARAGSPPLAAAALRLLGRMSADLARALVVFDVPGLRPLISELCARADDPRIGPEVLQLVAALIRPGFSRDKRDLLFATGMRGCCLAAAALSASPRAAYYVGLCVRNLATGCEASKDAAMDSGAATALATSLRMMLRLAATSGAASCFDDVVTSDGRILRLCADSSRPGVGDDVDLALNQLAHAVAVLASPSPSAAGMAPSHPAYNFAPLDARIELLLPTVPELICAWVVNSELEGPLTALKNVACSPGAGRHAVWQAARGRARQLFKIMDIAAMA